MTFRKGPFWLRLHRDAVAVGFGPVRFSASRKTLNQPALSLRFFVGDRKLTVSDLREPLFFSDRYACLWMRTFGPLRIWLT